VRRFKPGDEVFGIGKGSYAEYVCAREDKLAPKPANLTFEQAAVVAIMGSTALQALRVPFALVVIGFLFTMQQDARQQRIEDERAQQAQKIENQRAEAERKLAEQRAQDVALQAYLDQMSNLLLEKDLRNSEEDSEVRTLARARTLTVLGRLDPSRKTAVLEFLVEAELVQRADGRGPILGLVLLT
jgi:hypothetical protein